MNEASPLDALVAVARPGGTVMLARYEGRPAEIAWEAVTEPDERGLCVGSGPSPDDAVRVALAKVRPLSTPVEGDADFDATAIDYRRGSPQCDPPAAALSPERA